MSACVDDAAPRPPGRARRQATFPAPNPAPEHGGAPRSCAPHHFRGRQLRAGQENLL